MTKNLLKNKRGDIPITIFVVGVLAICTLAIFSFYFSDRNVKNSLSSVGIIEEILVIKEKIFLYRNLGFSEEEVTEIFGIEDDKIFKTKYISKEQGPITVRYNLPK